MSKLFQYTGEEWVEIKGKVGPMGPSGLDGKSIVGPKGKDGKNGSPDTGNQIVDKINGIDKKGPKIKTEHIEGFETVDSRLKTSEANMNSFFLKFAGDTVRLYDLSGDLDSITKTFTIPTNSSVIMVTGSSSPWFFRPTVDYTRTSNSITFTSEIDAATTLASGQSIGIIYIQP